MAKSERDNSSLSRQILGGGTRFPRLPVIYAHIAAYLQFQ